MQSTIMVLLSTKEAEDNAQYEDFQPENHHGNEEIDDSMTISYHAISRTTVPRTIRF